MFVQFKEISADGPCLHPWIHIGADMPNGEPAKEEGHARCMAVAAGTVATEDQNEQIE